MKPVTVSQLNGYIKRILATDPILMNISVSGEIANLTRHESGHWYFSLKDEHCRISCFLPRDRVERLRFPLTEGMKIVASGGISVYEPRGTFSLNVREIDALGEGDLKRAYEILKKKLEDEGLFDSSHKKPIPSSPKRIGVLTSPTGAAVHDIITTVRRRNPSVSLLVYPCLVQGPDAAESICRGLQELNEKFPGLDLIICGRGGGSAEDLWCFNEEKVVRAVYASSIPVISAVGHEVDYVLTDFAADLRGATPTAAAEFAVPDIEWVKDRLRRLDPQNMYSALQMLSEKAEMQLSHCLERAYSSLSDRYTAARRKADTLISDAASCNPKNLLNKGYAMVYGPAGRWTESAADVEKHDVLNVMFKDGNVKVLVLSKEELNNV